MPDEQARLEADSVPASRSKDPFAVTDHGDHLREDIAPAFVPVGSKMSDEWASEGKAVSESASKSKELTEDTSIGGDAGEGIAATVDSSVVPGKTDQTRPTDLQGSPVAVGTACRKQC